MPDSLSAALATLRRRYGPRALLQGDAHEPVECWPTGIPTLDGSLLPGGLPRGRVVVVAAASPHGPSGRLTLLQSLAALASRTQELGYVDLAGTLDPGFLADLGADLSACLVVSPGPDRWERGMAMGRSLVGAGLPWLGLALGPRQPRPALWDHALAALAETVCKRGAVCVIAAPAPPPLPLAHVSSLTLTCAAAGWHRVHGDVTGLRVRAAVTKCKVGPPGAEATLLLRFPRPYAGAEVLGLPSVVAPAIAPAEPVPALAAAPG
ncbi:MAG: hypothetical protein JOZ46_11605 [Candidatus Dormibacteraeota bacterium]|nr:hypothetical protein [Candidatus Dormibacteraeota bacterium]MBV9526448.1 hypothetical protein [Candidatus Dormibacteraeota bacterium]